MLTSNSTQNMTIASVRDKIIESCSDFRSKKQLIDHSNFQINSVNEKKHESNCVRKIL